MFHEIIKHSRKIKEKLEESKKSSTERWKEIITELLIIVFAVSLTTWFHDLNEHRSQQEEVKEFLTDIKDDLNKDIKGLENQKTSILQLIDSFKYVRNINKKIADSLDKVNPKFRLNTEFRLFFGEENTGNYEGFESSGKIVFIENKKLKKLILSYYKQHIPASEKIGGTFKTTFTKIGDFITRKIVVEKNNNGVLLEDIFQTDLEINIKHAKENIRIGDIGIKKIKEIITEIDRELKD
jgi:hypothetical protein